MLLLIFAIAFSANHAQQDDDLTAILAEIFTTIESPSNESCVCVPYHRCKNLTHNNVHLIDLRMQNGCESYLDVCCSTSLITNERMDLPPSPIKYCGIRNINGVSFQLNGTKNNEAEFAEFPWMVAILREESIFGSSTKIKTYHCGGSLIHPRVVITAAHWLHGQNRTFAARAGDWDTQTKKEMYPHQDREIEAILIHPHYKWSDMANDIAILILKSSFDIAENVNVVCLPPQNAVTENVNCIATGWGKQVFEKKGRYQTILKKVELPVVSRDSCQSIFRTTRLGRLFNLHRSFMCAGGEEGKDMCTGDGGSPLVCPIAGQPGRYYQAGIVAWGIGCGIKNPGVYVDVALFKNWIDQEMVERNLDVTSYQYEV